MDTKNIYVVGCPEFVLGFRLAGIKNVIEMDSTDINKYMEVLDEIVEKEDAGLVIVDALDFDKVPARKRAELESIKRPIMVALSKRMVASDSLRNKIVQAVGVDLLK